MTDSGRREQENQRTLWEIRHSRLKKRESFAVRARPHQRRSHGGWEYIACVKTSVVWLVTGRKELPPPALL